LSHMDKTREGKYRDVRLLSGACSFVKCVHDKL
jgi:hypothetical protein